MTTRFDTELFCERLHPLPTADDVADFYKKSYYEEILELADSDERKRAPDLQRLTGDSAQADAESTWLSSTLYRDIEHFVVQQGNGGKRHLDVGCGSGDLLAYMSRHGYETMGLEASPAAARRCRDRGLAIFDGELEQLVEDESGAFNVVSMLNVLEHVHDPLFYLDSCRQLLRPGGVVVVQVPNDFSWLQTCASLIVDASDWWIANPDHLNYWTMEGISDLLKRRGFDPRVLYGTFPMELFLLGGANYVDLPAQGKVAHENRKTIELALSDEQRRSMAARFASAGMGRNTLIVARVVDPTIAETETSSDA